MDKLDKMFDIQYRCQQQLENWDWDSIKKNPQLKQQLVNQMILACQEEIVEIMKESAYKNPDYTRFGWKKGQQWNEDNFKEEIVDLWHFVMVLWLTVNGTPDEFFNIYKRKNAKNIERWENNY